MAPAPCLFFLSHHCRLSLRAVRVLPQDIDARFGTVWGGGGINNAAAGYA